jgi:GNAT superfamily N-acetyltransferase
LNKIKPQDLTCCTLFCGDINWHRLWDRSLAIGQSVDTLKVYRIRLILVEIQIRTAQPDEIEKLIDLQSLSILNSPPRSRRYDRQQIDSLVCSQADSRRSCWGWETILVAENALQEVIGFACMEIDRGRITGLFVHPDFMGQGVGSRLLIGLENIALDYKIKTLWVLSSIEAIDFYRKNKYTPQGKTGFLSSVAVWIPCLILKKQLIPIPPIDRAISVFKFLATIALIVLLFIRIFYR